MEKRTEKNSSWAVEGQWLAEAPLIGQIFHDIVFTQNQFMRNHFFTVSQIVGRSGVGKSRLVHEIMAQACVLEKQTYYLDNDLRKTNFFSFVRKLVSDLEGLPEISSKKKLHILETYSQKESISVQILYNDSYLAHMSIKELSNYLFDLMKKKEVWLVLDKQITSLKVFRPIHHNIMNVLRHLNLLVLHTMMLCSIFKNACHMRSNQRMINWITVKH